MKRVLFVGDSITDWGRNREVFDSLGSGYVKLIADDIALEYPDQYEFLNRGISGNRSIDLLARIKSDIINLKPDFISILIGVNDVLHELDSNNGVDSDLFETYYEIIIEQLKKALPKLKIIVMEPFLLKGSATKYRWSAFRKEVEKRADIAEKIASKYNLTFVSLMQILDEKEKNNLDYFLTEDGVHPTYEGHKIIKHQWIKLCKNVL